MIISCEVFFDEYITRYDLNVEKINIKVKHMKKVKQVCEIIAKSLNLSDEEIQIACIIGLLHDLGRFYQIEKFDTFNDAKSIDHAEASNIILFDKGYIKKFVPSLRKYDEIIKKAIFYHNKFNVPDELTSVEKNFCNIIRDADKIDIFRVMGTEKFDEIYLESKRDELYISNDVREIFYSKNMVPNTLRTSLVDDYVSKLAYTFDFNFEISKQLLKKYGYLEIFHKSFIEKSGIKDKDVIYELNYMYSFIEKFLN